MAIIGFTGSREGMTRDQALALVLFVTTVRLAEGIKSAHHGDCFGADEQFHKICRALEIPVIVHPPEDDTYRAYCQGGEILEPKPFLERNRDIVDVADILVAAPKRPRPQSLRGQGTWSTIAYAQRIGRQVEIL